MAIALLTNHLVPYRAPLYERLAAEYGVEVLCYGGGERYMPSAGLADLDAQLASAPFPAHRLDGWRGAFSVGRRYQAVIAPYAGGPIFPAAYLGARRYRRPFVFWASVWAQPHSLSNDLALPLTRHIYRHADAVVAYGEHARRFVAGVRGRDDDVFVAPQAVEPERFARAVDQAEIRAFRARHRLPEGPLVLYAGRLVAAKGVEVLIDAWPRVSPDATLVVAGDGPLRERLRAVSGTRILGSLAREELPMAYAAACLVVVPSIPTPRWREPWGLVCNEALHQGRAVIATSAVGAVAGGLVRDGETGCVIFPGDADALTGAIERLLADAGLRDRLGAAGRSAAAAYTYAAAAAGFGQALAVALPRA
ncbi:MAG: glycosyltransferase family 4 protein [Solirubrobacteraceae bacterium]